MDSFRGGRNIHQFPAKTKHYILCLQSRSGTDFSTNTQNTWFSVLFYAIPTLEMFSWLMLPECSRENENVRDTHSKIGNRDDYKHDPFSKMIVTSGPVTAMKYDINMISVRMISKASDAEMCKF